MRKESQEREGTNMTTSGGGGGGKGVSFLIVSEIQNPLFSLQLKGKMTTATHYYWKLEHTLGNLTISSDNSEHARHALMEGNRKYL